MHKTFNPNDHLKMGGTVTHIVEVRPSWRSYRFPAQKLRGKGFTRKDKEESKVRRLMAKRSRRINRK